MVSAFNLGCTGKHVYSVCVLFTLEGKCGVISIYSGYFADVLLKPTKGARRLKDGLSQQLESESLQRSHIGFLT